MVFSLISSLISFCFFKIKDVQAVVPYYYLPTKKNLKIENPFSDDSKVKTDPDPRIKAEGKAGQSVEMGVIFVMSSNFLPDPGSEWIVGTCFKSPCVAAGNNELTSIYR